MSNEAQYENIQAANNSDLNVQIGARVRALRVACGLTLRDLATAADTQAGNISFLERGERRWNVDNLSMVAAALGVHPRELLPPVDEAPASTEHVAAGARANPPAPASSPLEQALLEAARAGDAPAALRALADLLQRGTPAAGPSPVQLALVALAELAPASTPETPPAPPRNELRRRLERLLR